MVAFFLSDARIGVVTSKVVTDGGELQSCGINVMCSERYYNHEPRSLSSGSADLSSTRQEV
jgi:hypothetical protein